MEWTKDGFTISCRPEKLDVDLIHGFLSQSSYWAAGIPRQTVERSLRGSICFAVHHDERQVGFARVVTDRATFAYLADVFIVPAYRGRGLSKWLMTCVIVHPDLRGLRRWLLATKDAHGLYERYGFVSLKSPPIFMERHDPEVYSNHDEDQQ